MTELQKYFKNEVMESMSKTVDSMYANGDEDAVIKLKNYVDSKIQDTKEIEEVAPTVKAVQESKPRTKRATKPAAAKKVSTDSLTAEDLEAMNDKELCVVLKDLGIVGKSKAKKTEKIDIILDTINGVETDAVVEELPTADVPEEAPRRPRRPRRA